MHIHKTKIKNREIKEQKLKNKKLEVNEVKKFLQGVVNRVSARGKYTVDSDILKIYDINNNGVITKSEVAAIKKDIK